MTGYDLYRKAMLRLGFVNNINESFSEGQRLDSAKEHINQIASDLNIDAIAQLGDEIKCSGIKSEALCCGVSMLIAFDEGDTIKNKLFTDIYNAKRATALSATDKVLDRLPIAESEV